MPAQSISKKVIKDQMGREVEINFPPERIISLVPSQTELLYDLGLGERVVGITKFCIHPEEWYRTKERVGGTKKVNFEKIQLLKPDLIIGNKEENTESEIKELMQQYPVWMSDIHNLPEALQMIRSVGAITDTGSEAAHLATAIEKTFEQLAHIKKGKERSVAYFIWQKPYMVAGGNTFINAILKKVGLKNVFEDKGRYPEVTAEAIAAAAPDLIFLSSEPYPFKEKHVQEFKSISPASEVQVVDGEMFSWYGSRLLKAPDYLKSLFS